MSDKVSKTLTPKIELFGGYIHEVKRGEDNNTSLPFQIFQLKKEFLQGLNSGKKK